MNLLYSDKRPVDKLISLTLICSYCTAIDLSDFTKCKLIAASDITPTIRSLRLQIRDKEDYHSLAFRPGQWVDFYVDHLQKLSGYSITSIPDQLDEDHSICLAVKQSGDVITKWVHSDDVLKFDQRDISVHLRVGGNFHFDRNEKRHYLLICGGIGITPLAAIFKYFCIHCDQSRVTLLYSASSPLELALIDELETAQKQAADRSDIVLAVTQHQGVEDESKVDDEWKGRTGRITTELIKEHRDKYIEDFDAKHCEYLICGPSAMIDEFNDSLQKELKVDSKQIWFEKWW